MMKKMINISAFMIIPVFSVVFACFACGKEKIMNVSTPPIADTTQSDPSTGAVYTDLKYLALGDSYTIGQNVEENERFTAQTVELLKTKNITITTLQYIATTGWTTNNLINAINLQDPPQNFDIVTLLIGVNDQYQRGDTTGYRTNFTTLLDKSVALAANRPSRVFVLSIPDYSVTPFVAQEDKANVSKQIDEFNAINKQLTLGHDIAYIEITTASREAANDATLIANDHLHPSGKEYAKWANLLAPVIRNAFK